MKWYNWFLFLIILLCYYIVWYNIHKGTFYDFEQDARIKVLESASTVAQRPQERNICDTVKKYVAFYPAGHLRVGNCFNERDTILTMYYSK